MAPLVPISKPLESAVLGATVLAASGSLTFNAQTKAWTGVPMGDLFNVILVTIVGALAINPEEFEYIDANITSRCTGTGLNTSVLTSNFSIDATDSIQLRLSDDYYASEGRSLDITSEGWPSLTGATVTFEVDVCR